METHRVIQSNLKFISRVKVGDKINVANMTVQTEGFFTTFLRGIYYNENRTKTLGFLNDTVTRALEAVKSFETSNSASKYDKMIRENLITDLVDAKIGLTNLQHTYEVDLKFVCDLETLLQHIETCLTGVEISR